MKKELENKLFKRYPKIFVKHSLSPHESPMCFGLECDDGWFWLIDKLCLAIQNYLENNKHLMIPQIEAVQIKEKFGGLRFYVNYVNDGIGGMIAFAECLSYSICERCGSTKDVTQNKKGWIRSLCKICREPKGGVAMKDKDAIRWLKKRVGNLMGCLQADRDEVYKRAIQALENQQAGKELRKESQ